MKKLFALLFILPIVVNAQSEKQITYVFNKVPVSGRDIRYLDTIIAPGLTKEQIYGEVKKWVAYTYRSANDVVQLDNREGGEVLVKGILDPGFSLLGSPFKCFHTLLIQFKDGKYRIDLTIYEITTTSTYIDRNPPQYYYNKLSKRNSEKLFLAINKSANDLTQSLNKSVLNAENSNW